MAPVLAQGPGGRFDDNRWDRADRIRARQLERLERRERFRERFRGDGVRLRVLKDYHLAEGETTAEPVVVIAGSAQIDGHCEDNVVVIGGNLRLGPTSVVDGDVVTVGGEFTRAPGATVRGSVDETRVPWPRVSVDPDWTPGVWWPSLAPWLSAIRMAFVLMLAMAITVVAPGWIGTIARRPAATSGLTGLAAEVLCVPAFVILVIALVVSIVGIPLLAALPLLVLAFGGFWVAGLAGVAVRVGSAIRGSQASPRASVFDLVLGYAVIVSLTIIGQSLAASFGWVSPAAWPVRSAGLLVEYVAWTIGLGAAITSLFSHRSAVPPPVRV
jgi:hypothetical protein